MAYVQASPGSTDLEIEISVLKPTRKYP